MPKLDGTGPDKKGQKSGRGLGSCQKIPDTQKLEQLGKGMGLRRQSGSGHGAGKRLKSGIQ